MKKGAAFLLVIALLFLSPAAYAAPMPGPEGFSDTKGHWAEAEIRKACTDGLMQGVGATEKGEQIFAPDYKVSRAQLAVVLAKTFQLDYGQLRFIREPAASDYFWDLNDDEWFANAAILCAVNRIYEAGREFHPEESITRIEAARSIYRAFEAKNIHVAMIMLMPNYSDAKELTLEDINAMVFVSNTGIMKGENNLFRPGDTITRGELARVLNRCFHLVKTNPPETRTNYSLSIGVQEEKSIDEYLEVDVNIPVIMNMANTNLQTSLNNGFKQAVAELKTELTTNAIDNKKSAEEMDYPFHRYALYTRAGPYFENSKVLSLYVDYYFYSGGAHGATDRRAYNYDVASGKVLNLKDIFHPGYQYKSLIDAAIRAEISQRPEDFFPLEMGFQGIAEQQNFYLQNDSLIIYFNQYEIAPYAAGIQEFCFPLRDFYKGLDPALKLVD